MAGELAPYPIIVYGAARSGTTYLIQILNKRPDVFISNETRLFVWVHEALNVLPKNERILRNDRDPFVAHLRANFPKMIRDFYRILHPQAHYWGDKNPHYASVENRGCLESIATLFPESRFIHIIRDGRDVVTSCLRGSWKDFDSVHYMWTSHLEIGSKFGRSLPANRYFELRYEDLVRDDLGTTRKLFDFLGIDIHPDVVKFCQAQREKRTPFCKPTRDLNEDVLASDWKKLLSPKQQVRSLELLGKYLVAYGYETESSFLKAYRESADQLAYALIRPVRAAVCKSLPSDATVMVVSKGDDELLDLDGRRAWHFPQADDGVYVGYHPGDSSEAIDHLEAQRAKGGEFLLFPHTAFWWLDHYAGFHEHLKSHYPKIWSDESCIIYQLSKQQGNGSGTE